VVVDEVRVRWDWMEVPAWTTPVLNDHSKRRLFRFFATSVSHVWTRCSSQETMYRIG
jgi:hypothetical protein